MFLKKKGQTCKTSKPEFDKYLKAYSEFITQSKNLSSAFQNSIDLKEIVVDMLDVLPEFIWFKDADFRFVFLNHVMAQRLYGRLREQVIGYTHGELLYSSAAYINITDSLTLMARVKSRFIQRAVTRVGELWFDCYKVPIFDPSGEFKGLVGCAREVTKYIDVIKDDLNHHDQSEYLGSGYYHVKADRQLYMRYQVDKLGSYLQKLGVDSLVIDEALEMQKTDALLHYKRED